MAVAIHVALIDFHEGQAKPGGLDVMTVILSGVVNEDETGWHLGSNRAEHGAALDHDRLDHRHCVAIYRPVKALDRGWQTSWQRDGLQRLGCLWVWSKGFGFDL